MKNNLDDLRDHLFMTIEALRDEEKPMDIDRAKAICEVSQQLINTAKTEVAFLEVVGGRNGSKFLENKKPEVPGLGEANK